MGQDPAPEPADGSEAQPIARDRLSGDTAGKLIPLLDERATNTRADRDGEPQAGADRISIEELRRLLRQGEPVVLLDVRTERSFGASDLQASGAIRLPPDHVAERAEELGLPRDAWLVAFCA
jgi:hypothetical protein